MTDLPASPLVPEDDGGCDHLPGMAVAPVALASTQGGSVRLDTIPGRSVVYCYPMTAGPDASVPSGWDEIPGARGCTPQSCSFRDHSGELAALGAGVFGLSTQDTDYQREMAERLALPFPVLSDASLAFGRAMNLPRFEADGLTLLRRATLVLRDGVIEHVLYPVFPPEQSAADTLGWLRANPL